MGPLGGGAQWGSMGPIQTGAGPQAGGLARAVSAPLQADGAGVSPSAHWALREFRPGEPAAALTVSHLHSHSLPGSPRAAAATAGDAPGPALAMIPTPHQGAAAVAGAAAGIQPLPLHPSVHSGLGPTSNDGPGPLGLRLKRTPSMTRLFKEHVAAFKERQQEAMAGAGYPAAVPPQAHHFSPAAPGLYGGLSGPMSYGGGFHYPMGVLATSSPGLGPPANPAMPGSPRVGATSLHRKLRAAPAKKSAHHNHSPAPKMKASNFTGSSLEVGSWKKNSVYEGDLVAKFYYAKRKLVWEVLEAGLKSKIEVLWDSVTSLKCHIARGSESYLEVEIDTPPAMYRESNPQPRKHTIWQACPDFTDGQAAMATMHRVTFPAGVLNKHYYKLLQCEPRLAVLAAKSGSPTLCGDSFFKPAELSSSPPPLVEDESSKGAEPSNEEADSQQVTKKDHNEESAPVAPASPNRTARPKRAAARVMGERLQAAGIFSKKPKLC